MNKAHISNFKRQHFLFDQLYLFWSLIDSTLLTENQVVEKWQQIAYFYMKGIYMYMYVFKMQYFCHGYIMVSISIKSKC